MLRPLGDVGKNYNQDYFKIGGSRVDDRDVTRMERARAARESGRGKETTRSGGGRRGQRRQAGAVAPALAGQVRGEEVVEVAFDEEALRAQHDRRQRVPARATAPPKKRRLAAATAELASARRGPAEPGARAREGEARAGSPQEKASTGVGESFASAPADVATAPTSAQYEPEAAGPVSAETARPSAVGPPSLATALANVVVWSVAAAAAATNLAFDSARPILRSFTWLGRKATWPRQRLMGMFHAWTEA